MNFEAARDFINNKLERELPSHLTYHNLAHTIDVYEASERLATEENITGEEKQLLLIAAMYHDAGFIIKQEGHELISCEMAKNDLPRFDFTPAQIEIICDLIMATRLPRFPKNTLQKIIADADLDYLGRDDFFRRAKDLYSELKHFGKIKDEKSWNQLQIKFLQEHTYYTQSAMDTRNKKKSENLSQLKAQKHSPGKRDISLTNTVTDYVVMILGVVISGFGLEGFLVPNKFLDGGLTGISLLLNDLYHFNLAYVIILVNLPFIIAGIYVLNMKFAIKTFFCVVALALCLLFIHYPTITSDKLLISIFGGFFLGLGIGLCMRAGFALDGIEILALYTWKRTSFSISEIILGINILIFSVATINFGMETALYSMLTYFAATRTIDYVIEGWEAFTGVTIISGKSEEIKHTLVLGMNRGITVYKGERGFLPEAFEVSHNCDIIFTVVTRLEVRRLKNMVNVIDPKAFVFISTIKEASGGIIKRKNIH